MRLSCFPIHNRLINSVCLNNILALSLINLNRQLARSRCFNALLKHFQSWQIKTVLCTKNCYQFVTVELQK